MFPCIITYNRIYWEKGPKVRVCVVCWCGWELFCSVRIPYKPFFFLFQELITCPSKLMLDICGRQKLQFCSGKWFSLLQFVFCGLYAIE